MVDYIGWIKITSKEREIIKEVKVSYIKYGIIYDKFYFIVIQGRQRNQLYVVIVSFTSSLNKQNRKYNDYICRKIDNNDPSGRRDLSRSTL